MNKRTVFTNDLLNESYIKVQHKSGLEIYLCKKPEFSTSYSVFGTKYGSIDTCFTKVTGEQVLVPEGIAHFLEHKLFESEEVNAFERYAKTGAYSNAFTSFDKTCYVFSCSDNFYENLTILIDFVMSPYFTDQTVLKEQGIIGQEINMYADSAGWCVMFNMLKAMYKNHPVRIDIAGTVQSIANITKDLLYDCYETFYNPSNMFICIAGNIDIEKTLDIIDSHIKPKDSVLQSRNTEPEPEGVAQHFVEQTSQVAMPVFCYGFKERETNLSLKDKICSEMLLEIIASDISPLYDDLNRKGLINDEFSTDYFCGRGYAVSMFEGESADPKKVAESILSEINRLKNDGIDKTLFSSVLKGWYGSAIRRFNSSESIAMQMVECAVDSDEVFDELEILKSITLEDVQEKLNNLRQENAVLSVIFPKEEL